MLISLDLPASGVKLGKNGFIVCDEYQNTNVEGIYALGDVCGIDPLTPVAIAAGRKLSDRLFGGEQFAESKLDVFMLFNSLIHEHPFGCLFPSSCWKYRSF
jgi:glutathione reductase (NADPH)